MVNTQNAYPENLQVLLDYADELATTIAEKLNQAETKTVKDFYILNANKIFRNQKVFNEFGYVPNEISKASKNGQPNEFKGLYVFGEEIEGKVIPAYVGISRTVFRRLRQHAWGNKPNECSLAYLKTKDRDKSITREKVKNEDMEPAKSVIRSYKLVLIHVPEDYDLYFLEVALAGKFKTKWNSFRTH